VLPPSVESFQIAILINFLPTLVGDIWSLMGRLVFEAVTLLFKALRDGLLGTGDRYALVLQFGISTLFAANLDQTALKQP